MQGWEIRAYHYPHDGDQERDLGQPGKDEEKAANHLGPGNERRP